MKSRKEKRFYMAPVEYKRRNFLLVESVPHMYAIKHDYIE